MVLLISSYSRNIIKSSWWSDNSFFNAYLFGGIKNSLFELIVEIFLVDKKLPYLKIHKVKIWLTSKLYNVLIYQKLIFPGKNVKRGRHNKICFLAFLSELYNCVSLAKFKKGEVAEAHPLAPPHPHLWTIPK